MVTRVTDINVGSDWDETTLSADSSLSVMGDFQNDQITILDEDMTSDPGFTEFGSGAGSFSYDAINDDYDVDTRRNVTPHGIFLALGASYDLTDNFKMTFEFTPSVMASGSLSVFGLFNSANRARSGILYNNTFALGIAASGTSIFYVQNSAGGLTQFSLGSVLSVGNLYRVVLENSLSDGQVTITIYENGTLVKVVSLGASGLGSVTVNEFGVRNAGSSSSDAIIAVDLNSLIFQSDFATAAKTIETEIVGIVGSFDSDDVRFKTDRTLAAGTEIKLYVKLDGGAFGAAINANTTPVAGLTGVYQFAAGTTFTPTVNALLKIEINSPDVNTQIQVSTPWIDGVTVTKYSVDTDPNDTIRQRIIDTLITRFSTILISNGYKTDLGENVSRWKETQVPQEDLPHLAWRDDDEDETEATVGQIDHTLVIECRISTKTEDDLYAARADLIQAMGTDRLLGGLVGNTKPPEEVGQADHGDQKVWTQTYRFTLEYPTDQFDEYNN